MENIQGETQQLLQSSSAVHNEKKKSVSGRCWCLLLLLWSIFFSCIISTGITLSVVLTNKDNSVQPLAPLCTSTCKLTLVESIPENVSLGLPSHKSTYDSWMFLLQSANTSVDIASFYWILRGTPAVNDVTDKQGQDIYDELRNAHSRGVTIRVVQSSPSDIYHDDDSKQLFEDNVIELRNLSVEAFLGAGILHTKLWIIDSKHFYVGSANMDWRSLTQVKELGLMGLNCSCLANDFDKIFEVYWKLSDDSTNKVPRVWAESLYADYNLTNPAYLPVNDSMAQVYIASSPPNFNPPQRTNDIDALLDVINSANEFIYVAVMDYIPAIIYENPNRYWPLIDDALRAAAYNRGVKVHLLGSYWGSTRNDMLHFLHSLGSLNTTGPLKGTIETKCFVVPELVNKSIPYTRVNHNKYMVTENTAYIGTSNWSGDYFTKTGGVSFLITQSNSTTVTVQNQLKEIFERDWNSIYADSCPLNRKL